jgi:hypothetical protein
VLFPKLRHWLSGTAASSDLDKGAIPSLKRLSEGFALYRSGEWVSVPWGTSSKALGEQGFELAQKYDVRAFLLPASAIYFDADIANIETFQTSDLPDRPIEQVWYAIRSSDQCSHQDLARKLHKRFIAAWGKPHHGDVVPAFKSKQGSSDVASHAEWRYRGIRARLSWYGKRRRSEGALTAGFVSLDWDDVIAMAAPFVQSARDREQALSRLSDPKVNQVALLADLKMNTLPVRPTQHYHFDAPDASKASPTEIFAHRALYAPDLVNTSQALKTLVREAGRLVLWKAGEVWGVSSYDDTLLVDPTKPVKVRWDHVTPGRGGGSENLAIGSLKAYRHAQSLDQCADLQAFINALKQFPQVNYEFCEYSED